ncbi:hypothetical protein HDU76_008784, partial [Blyttiomyces sp. JEL0837]
MSSHYRKCSKRKDEEKEKEIDEIVMNCDVIPSEAKRIANSSIAYNKDLHMLYCMDCSIVVSSENAFKHSSSSCERAGKVVVTKQQMKDALDGLAVKSLEELKLTYTPDLVHPPIPGIPIILNGFRCGFSDDCHYYGAKFSSMKKHHYNIHSGNPFKEPTTHSIQSLGKGSVSYYFPVLTDPRSATSGSTSLTNGIGNLQHAMEKLLNARKDSAAAYQSTESTSVFGMSLFLRKMNWPTHLDYFKQRLNQFKTPSDVTPLSYIEIACQTFKSEFVEYGKLVKDISQAFRHSVKIMTEDLKELKTLDELTLKRYANYLVNLVRVVLCVYEDGKESGDYFLGCRFTDELATVCSKLEGLVHCNDAAEKWGLVLEFLLVLFKRENSIFATIRVDCFDVTELYFMAELVQDDERFKHPNTLSHPVAVFKFLALLVITKHIGAQLKEGMTPEAEL